MPIRKRSTRRPEPRPRALTVPTAAGGKPTLYPEAKVKKTILLTRVAVEKAARDAKAMGAGVSISSAIETAIRAYVPKPIAVGGGTT